MLKARFLLPECCRTQHLQYVLFACAAVKQSLAEVNKSLEAHFGCKHTILQRQEKRRSNGDSLAKMEDKMESLRGRQMHTLWWEK